MKVVRDEPSSVGMPTVLLAWSLSQEDRHQRQAEAAAANSQTVVAGTGVVGAEPQGDEPGA